MAGLVLNLSPKERIILEGGGVVENGDRRTKLHFLTPDTRVLRASNCVDSGTPNPSALEAFQIALQKLYLRQEPLEKVLNASRLLGQECRDVEALVQANMKDPMTGQEIFNAFEATRKRRNELACKR